MPASNKKIQKSPSVIKEFVTLAIKFRSLDDSTLPEDQDNATFAAELTLAAATAGLTTYLSYKDFDVEKIASFKDVRGRGIDDDVFNIVASKIAMKHSVEGPPASPTQHMEESRPSCSSSIAAQMETAATPPATTTTSIATSGPSTSYRQTPIISEGPRYYAVTAGKSLGVYLTYEEAMEQSDPVLGFQYKEFRILSQAVDYVQTKRNTGIVYAVRMRSRGQIFFDKDVAVANQTMRAELQAFTSTEAAIRFLQEPSGVFNTTYSAKRPRTNT